MLRRVEDARVELRRDGFWDGVLDRGHLHLVVGAREWRLEGKASRRELDDAVRLSDQRPVPLAEVDGRTYYLWQERWFSDDEGLDADDVHALLLVREEQVAGRLRRARTHRERLDEAERLASSRRARGVVAGDVRAVVWARDGGRCTACGATTELQFDHVIPLSLGGSSTEANVQLLCGPCNRAKGASVTS